MSRLSEICAGTGMTEEEAYTDALEDIRDRDNVIEALRGLIRDIHRAVDRNALLITKDPELRDGAIAVWERIKEVVSG